MNDEIGSRLRALRRAKDLTQADVAGALGLTQSGYSKIEKGQRRLPTDKLLVLAELLDVAPATLLPAAPSRQPDAVAA